MLRMTKQADYGIVLLSHMATGADRRFAASELSSATGLPLPTVSKILKLLSRDGLLDSHRGAKGGYSLALAPREINVARMIAALEGPIAFTECIEDSPGECSQEATCGIRANWQRINRAVVMALADISLAELTATMVDPPLVQLGVRPSRTDSGATAPSAS